MRWSLSVGVLVATLWLGGSEVCAQTMSLPPIPKISVGVEEANSPQELSLTLQLLILLTVLALAPSILVMMTCFTRIIVVFFFLKQALGTQMQPPSQLLTGLALFLTFFVMQPVLDEANEKGLQPYLRQEITQQQAVENMVRPFREYMLKRVRQEDLALFLRLSGARRPKTPEEVSIWALIPAFAISELRVAFQIGFLLFLPFLVIDLIVASVLLSLGIFLLPPQLISLPAKVLLFVLVDGWNLLIGSLLQGILAP
ncbi:MAG: flagellar type III secretion system pore protein FliP [Candidatus Kapabacteria bacterium]|nr:flagellar type III secretion system pore protein FliP [Candidatus Kapabacteria bacterium]MDW8011755.1 flagellar type III secretion system pore protein FliP [Bacteroidota bacterium]